MQNTTQTNKGIKTNNESWGFFNGCRDNTLGLSYKGACGVFESAGDYLMQFHKLSAEQAVELLDSQFGRYLADRLTYHIQERWPEPQEVIDAFPDVFGEKWAQKKISEFQ